MSSVQIVSTEPYRDQKLGTAGLRRRVKVFQQKNYLENFIQAIFNSLPKEEYIGGTLLVSGDGRFYNREAIQKTVQVAAGNGVKEIWIGQHGLVSTPAASAIIRERENGKCFGGVILTASHNPGGPDEDFGIKYNVSNGGPALETLTDIMFEESKKITFFKQIELPHINIDIITEYHLLNNQLTIKIIDSIETWMSQMKKIFDFPFLQKFLHREDFHFVYDGLHGVAGIYAKQLFLEELQLKSKKGLSGKDPNLSLQNCEPKEDFGKSHPDPNLTYAKDLVKVMKVLNPNEVTESTPDFGAAGDGDNDRNMILGKGFFVTPSDSVAIIASYVESCVPYFQKKKIKGLARSMPTSCALNHVARDLNVPMYETPTGWKYFGNLMEADQCSICGEESFGTGSDHIREKDGLWAVLCWLSILAHANEKHDLFSVTVEQITHNFWKKYGRNYYTRYDYESIETPLAEEMMDHLTSLVQFSAKNPISTTIQQIKSLLPVSLSHLLDTPQYALKCIDEFTYRDPIDKSITENSGIRFLFEDGSRIIWRKSGTGSEGITIRIYVEKYEKENIFLETKEALKTLIDLTLNVCQIQKFCHREKPTVIT